MKTKFVVFIFFTVLFSACAKHRAVPMDIQCNENIKVANKYVQDAGDNFDKSTLEKIKNLIEAAKIQQQHAEFASCIDKVDRALTLLNTEQQ